LNGATAANLDHQLQLKPKKKFAATPKSWIAHDQPKKKLLGHEILFLITLLKNFLWIEVLFFKLRRFSSLESASMGLWEIVRGEGNPGGDLIAQPWADGTARREPQRRILRCRCNRSRRRELGRRAGWSSWRRWSPTGTSASTCVPRDDLELGKRA